MKHKYTGLYRIPFNHQARLPHAKLALEAMLNHCECVYVLFPEGSGFSKQLEDEIQYSEDNIKFIPYKSATNLKSIADLLDHHRIECDNIIYSSSNCFFPTSFKALSDSIQEFEKYEIDALANHPIQTKFLSAPQNHEEKQVFPCFISGIFSANFIQAAKEDKSLGRANIFEEEAFNLNVMRRFNEASEQRGLKIAFCVKPGHVHTGFPGRTQPSALIANDALCVPCPSNYLGVLEQDIFAINWQSILQELDNKDEGIGNYVRSYFRQNLPARESLTALAKFKVLPTDYQVPSVNTRLVSETTLAVFVHVYYSEMLDEFLNVISRISVPFTLYCSTSSAENKQIIDMRLAKAGYERFEVRIVEQNRGRDMSSLFITFRDVIIEDRHEIALRLHSKKTPQVHYPVGQYFKNYLFENLIASKEYVLNVINEFYLDPNIGVIFPPTINQGFGTLGHAWRGNDLKTREYIQKMGLKIILDQHTPVAPYGTMYWFRTKALKPIFEFEWQWSNYNEEPHHVDGGLAHVQERLIGYVAIGQGYDVMQVLSDKHVGRSYLFLEYKLAELLSLTPEPLVYHIANQKYQSQSQEYSKYEKLRNKFKYRLRLVYANQVVSRPKIHRRVQPVVKMLKNRM